MSIIFEDNNYNEAARVWNDSGILCSSIVLDIEAMINVYKFYCLKKKDEILYRKKKEQLRHLLNTINRKTVDDEIVIEIENMERLKYPKSLDSIHLATANIFAKTIDVPLLLCTYDNNMIKTGNELGMNTLLK
mgnify:FL=1